MAIYLTPLERAFELARSGSCATCSDIRRKLLQEGFSDAQLNGPMLQRQLRGEIRQARAQLLTEGEAQS